MTDCQCVLAGHCTRHDVDKTKHLLHLCQTRQDYFDAWEQGRGPGQLNSVDKARRRKIITKRQSTSEVGKKLWAELFTKVNDISSLEAWEEKIPKYGCDCKQFYQHWKKLNPPNNISFEWKYNLRSAVNTKLGAPNITLEEAKAQWLHIGPKKSSKLILSLATGPQALQLHAITGPNQRAYAEKVGADYICLQNRLYDSWQLEKLRASFFVNQYEWILWVDNDLFFTSECPDIFAEHQDPSYVYGVDDTDYLPDVHAFDSEMQQVMESQEILNITSTDRMINSGMILASNQSASWVLPNNPLPLTHCSEQLWHDYCIGARFKKIDRRWNWQAWQKDFDIGAHNAYIIHLAGIPHEQRMKLAEKYIAL